jgi:hypothetical protein
MGDARTTSPHGTRATGSRSRRVGLQVVRIYHDDADGLPVLVVQDQT